MLDWAGTGSVDVVVASETVVVVVVVCSVLEPPAVGAADPDAAVFCYHHPSDKTRSDATIVI